MKIEFNIKDKNHDVTIDNILADDIDAECLTGYISKILVKESWYGNFLDHPVLIKILRNICIKFGHQSTDNSSFTFEL